MHAVVPWIWLAVGGGMAGLAMSRTPIPIAMWLAPALLLHFMRETPFPLSLPSIWVVLCVAVATVSRGMLPVSGVRYLFVTGAAASGWVLPFVADRLVVLPGFASTLVYPLAWIAVEFLSGFNAGRASWGAVAYSQHGDLPLLQVTSLTGLAGVTFLIGWFASTVNWAWDRRFTWDAIRSGVVIYAAVFSLVSLAGAARLAWAATGSSTVRIAAITVPKNIFPPGEVTRTLEGRPSEELASLRAKLTRLQDWFVERSRREIRAGARIVAWPEVGLIVLEEDEPAFLERARQLAHEEQAYLVMGLGVVRLGEPRPLTNKVVLVSPSGEVEFDYVKTLLVPGWEASIAKLGDGQLRVGPTPYGRLAAAICYEADFPAFMRQVGRSEADLLIVPANDWQAIKDVHFRMAVVRAIENGVPLIRATASGVSGAVDPYGRVLALTDHFAGGETMVAEVPVGRVPTLYARVGDVFAWLSVAILVLMIGWAVLLARR